MKVVDVAILSLQGKQLNVASQRCSLQRLVADMRLLGAVPGPLSQAEKQKLHETDIRCGKYAIYLVHVRTFVDNCGSFIVQRIQAVPAPLDGDTDPYMQVLRSIGRLFVQLISGND